MRRFFTLMGVALAGYAVYTELVPNAVQAQVVQVQVYRPYTPVVVQPTYLPPVFINPPPVFINPPPVVSYYPSIAPSYPATISTYPQSAVTYSYYAPATVVAPASGVYTTRTYRGFGIFRPRGYYSESTYTPYYP